MNPRDRSLGDTKFLKISHWSRIEEDIQDRVGCYAILYQASADSFYAAYIGFSKVLGRELRIRYDGWGIHNATFPFTAAYISNSAVASAYEDDLIRYYCPPWNTKFHRQGIQRGRQGDEVDLPRPRRRVPARHRVGHVAHREVQSDGMRSKRLVVLTFVVAAASGCSRTGLTLANGEGAASSYSPTGACTGGAASGEPVTLASPLYPRGIAVYGTSLYWRESVWGQGEPDALVAVPVTGGTPVTLTESEPGNSNIAVGPTGVYWGDNVNVLSVPVAGGAVTTIASEQDSWWLAIDPVSVYWAGFGGIVKAPLDGGAPVTLAPDAHGATIAVHAGRVYWGQGTSLTSMSVDGGTQSTMWSPSGADGRGAVNGIAFDASALYLTWWSASAGGVARVPLAGGPAVTLATTTDPRVPTSIAVDSANVYYAVADDSGETCGGVLRVPIQGGAPVTVGIAPVNSIALDCESVYWSQVGECGAAPTSYGAIVRVAKP